jgi:hypothetical protein
MKWAASHDMLAPAMAASGQKATPDVRRRCVTFWEGERVSCAQEADPTDGPPNPHDRLRLAGDDRKGWVFCAAPKGEASGQDSFFRLAPQEDDQLGGLPGLLLDLCCGCLVHECFSPF